MHLHAAVASSSALVTSACVSQRSRCTHPQPHLTQPCCSSPASCCSTISTRRPSCTVAATLNRSLARRARAGHDLLLVFLPPSPSLLFIFGSFLFAIVVSIVVSILSSSVALPRCRAAASHAARRRLSCLRACASSSSSSRLSSRSSSRSSLLMSRCRAVAPQRLTPLAIASAAVERALRLLLHLDRHLDPLFSCRVAALSRRRVSRRSPSPQVQSSVRFFFFFISISHVLHRDDPLFIYLSTHFSPLTIGLSTPWTAGSPTNVTTPQKLKEITLRCKV